MKTTQQNKAINSLKHNPFEQRFKALNALKSVFSVSFSVLSVLTAGGFFYDLLKPLMPHFILAIVVSLLFLVLTELAERGAASEFFYKHFNTKCEDSGLQGKAGFLRGSAFGFTLLLSLALSSVGSYYSYKNISNTKGVIKDAYSVQGDSISNVWDNQIKASEAAANDFYEHNKISVRGNFVLRDRATNVHNNLVAATLDLKKQKKEAANTVKAEEITAILDGTNKTEYNAFMGVAWVIFLSLSKHFFTWFGFYYDYRTLKDSGLLPLIKGKTFEPLNTDYTVKTPVYTEETEDPQRLAAKTSEKKIGFSQPRACLNCEKTEKVSKRNKTAKFCDGDCKNEYHNHKK